MGTSSFALPTLSRIYEKGHDIVRVFSQPDSMQGRGLRLKVSPVKKLAMSLALCCEEPMSLKKKEIEALLLSLDLDVGVVVSYGHILPKSLLEIPRYGFINLHPSLLPKYRGPSPIQTAIANGESETGVSVMQLSEEMDAGPIYSQVKEKILQTDDFESLETQLSSLGAEMLCECLDKIDQKGSLPSVEQDDESSTYCSKIDSSFSLIDWSWSSMTILNRIRSLSFPKGGKTFWSHKLLKIFEIEVCDLIHTDKQYPVGMVVEYDKNRGLNVQTGSGFILIKSLQMEGGKILSVQNFMNGKGRNIVRSILKKH